MSQKQKLVNLLKSGAFVRFGPQQLEELHEEVAQFLAVSEASLDAVDLFDIYELQFYALLFTNRDVQAKSYLDQFNDQFYGKLSQKLLILRLMYYEATGDNKSAVDALGSDPDELRNSRRLATYSRTKADGSPNTEEYIQSLNYYLDLQPADAVAWAELGDAYSSVGHYQKAVFCFKEVLLHHPDAYNMFYRAGLNLYLDHLSILRHKSDRKDTLVEALAALQHSQNCFLRSVEICETYTKGWLGVYVTSASELWAKVEANRALAASHNLKIDSSKKLKELSAKKLMQLNSLGDEAAFKNFIASSELQDRKAEK